MTTFSCTNEDTGRTFTFASEEVYERAIDWYNATGKGGIQEFCAAYGVDLSETTDDPRFESGVKLVDDWADVAMELYAQKVLSVVFEAALAEATEQKCRVEQSLR